MNQTRAQRYTTAILALLGLVIGSNLGALADQASGQALNPERLAAFRECYTCIDAALPFLADAANTSRWMLAGGIIGLLAGLAIAWALRLISQRTQVQPKRLSSFRQASELARFSRALGDTLELPPILGQLHTEAMQVSGADCGSSFLLDPLSPDNRITQRVGEAAELQRLAPMETTAVSTGRSRIVQDFDSDGDAPPHVGVRSALLMPITHEEHAIGLIHLHSQQAAAFDNEIHDFVQALAAQAGLAIHNAQRYQEQARRSEGLRQRVNQLQQLAHIPNAVRADRTLAENLEAIARSMQEVANFRQVLISVYVPADNHLEHAASAGMQPGAFDRLRQAPLAWERVQPFLHEELGTRRIYLAPQAQTAELYQVLELGAPKQPTEPRLPGQWRPDDMLLAPLYGSRSGVEGLLSVGAPRDASTPQGLVLEMIEVFASQAALAIENARMLAEAEARLGEAQARAVQLSALTEATGLVSSALRVDEVVTLTLDQLQRVLPYDNVTFWRSQTSDGRWRLIGSRSSHEDITRVVARIEQAQPAVFGEISATRGVMTVADVSRDVRFPAREASSMRSWLGAPLLSRGEVIGVLSLEKAEDNYYGPQHAPLALAFANRAAAALENARLYEESVQHARELEARAQRLALVNRVAIDASAANDLDAILRLTLSGLAEALSVDQASALLFESDAAGAAFVALAAAHHPANEKQAIDALALANNPLLERLQETAGPEVAEADDEEDSAAPLRSEPEHIAWVGAGVQAAAFLPLLAEGRLLGVIGVGYTHDERKFSPADIDLAFAVAQQAAAAVHSLRLRQKNREQAIINQLARAISRAGDMNQLWDIVRGQLAALPGFNTFSVALYDDARNEVSFPLRVVNAERRQPAVDAGRAPSGLLGHILQKRQVLLLAGDIAGRATALGLNLGPSSRHPVHGEALGAEFHLARAYLGAPMELGGQLLGALVAEDPARPDAYDDSHARILSAAASQIAVALEGLRLLEMARQATAASQQRASQLETLAETATALAPATDSRQAASAALDQARRLLPYDRAALWQHVPGAAGKAGQWQVLASRGELSHEPDASLLAARGPLALSDTSADKRLPGPARSWLGLPMLHHGQAGWMLALEKDETGFYTPAHAELGQAFASRAQAAMQNARLLEGRAEQAQALEARSNRLALLNHAAGELAASLDVDTVLRTTLKLAADVLGARQSAVLLYDEALQTASLAANLPAAPAPRGAPMGLASDPLLARMPAEALPVAVDDLPAEDYPWLAGTGAALLTPLHVKGEPIGLLALRLPQAGAADIELAQSLAELAAPAIADALQYRKAQQRLSEAASINQMSRALSQALDLEQLGLTLRAQLEAWLDPDQAVLAVYDPTANRLTYALAVEDGQHVERAPRAPDGLLGRVLNDREALRLNGDLPSQLRELALSAEPPAPARAFLAVPVMLGDNLLGVLAVADPARAESFTDSHQRMLSALAAQAAINLDHAQLLAENSQRLRGVDARAQRLAWLNQVSADLAASLDLQSILRRGLGALSELLNAPRASSLVFDDASQAVEAHIRFLPGGDASATGVQPNAPTNNTLLDHLLPRLRDEAQPIALNELADQPWYRPEQLDWLGAEAADTTVYPLTVRGKLIGLLGFERPADGAPGKDEQAAALAVANLMAAAAHNARHHSRMQAALINQVQLARQQVEQAKQQADKTQAEFQAQVEQAKQQADEAQAQLQAQVEQAKQRTAEQAAINQFTRAISRSFDLRELYHSLQTQFGAWLDPRRLYLALHDETRNTISFPLALEAGQPVEISPRAPDSLVGHILKTQQPLRLNGDINAHLAAMGLPADAPADMRAYLGVPLRLGDKSLGVLSLADPRSLPALTESHQRILNAIAAQVAAVIDNSRLHEQARQAMAAAQERADQLATLTDALSSVSAPARVEEIIGGVLEHTVKIAPYVRAAFWLRGPTAPAESGEAEDSGWSLAQTRMGDPQAESAGAPTLPAALAAELVAARTPLPVNDARRDARFKGAAAGSWLGVPIVSQGEVYGLLALEGIEPFSDGQAGLLNSFSRQAGLALDNARRYEDGLQRSRRLEQRGALLSQSAAELGATVDLDRLLPIAARALATTLGADQAGVLVFHEQPAVGSAASAAGSGPGAGQLLAHARFPSDASETLRMPPVPESLQGREARALLDRLQEAVAPVSLAEAGGKPEHLAWIGSGLQSALFLPLRVGDRLVGVAGLGQRSRRQYSEAELELAQTVSVQAANALHNALLLDATRQQLDEQAAVNQAMRTLNRARDLKGLVDMARARMGAWLGVNTLYLALYDEAADEASLPLLVDDDQPREMPPFAPGGLLRHVLQTRQTLVLNGDINLQCRALGIPISFVDHRPLRWSREKGEVLTANSYLAVPVLLGESVIGALAIESAQSEAAFGERHERILAAIATQVSLIVDSSRLYEQTRTALAAAQVRVTELEALTGALSSMATALYSDDVISLALEQFQRVIAFDQVTFWKRDAGAGSGRDVGWRVAGARGFPDSAERTERALSPDHPQRAALSEVASARRIVFVPDTAQDARFSGAAARSWLGVPLMDKGEVTGLLAVEKLEPGFYHAGHVPAAQLLANQITALLGNARQYEYSLQRVLELDERSRRLAFLSRFSAEVSASLSMTALLQLALKALTEALGLEQGAAAVFDETRSAVLALVRHPAEAPGGPALLSGPPLPGNMLVERLRETPAPITLEDVSALEPGSRLRQAEWIGRDVRAAMFLPLVTGGELIGLLGLGHSQPGRRFSPSEMELAMSLARQAAAAAHNARLYDRVQQRLSEQSTLNQISRALSRGLDTRGVLETLQAQLHAWVGPRKIYLGVYNEAANEISFPLAIEDSQPATVSPRAPAGLVRHLLQQRLPLLLNGEITQQLKDLGLYTTGVGSQVGLDDVADFNSYIGVPLLSGQDAAGVLLVGGPARVEAFDESHERILLAVASQAAAALEHARRYDIAQQALRDSQARAAQQGLLTETAGILNSALRSEQVINLSLDQLERLLPYDQVTFWRRADGEAHWRASMARPAANGGASPLLELNSPDSSPLAEVLSTRASLVVPDTRRDARFTNANDGGGSWMGIPLVHKGEVLGLLSLDKAQANGYSASQLPLAQAFAAQTAAALSNVRLYEDSLQRALELDERSALINRVSAALSGTVDPQKILDTTLAALATALHMDRAAAIIFEDNPLGNQALARAAYPPHTANGAAPLPLSGSALLDQLRERLAPIAVENLATDGVITREHAAWVAPEAQSALFLPLIAAGRLVGLIGLVQLAAIGGQAPRGFSAGDMELAQTLANQAAVAEHNARLHQRTQRRLVELAAISQTRRDVGPSLDLTQLFETVRAQVDVALRTDSMYVALYDEARGQVTYPLMIQAGQNAAAEPGAPDPLVRQILTHGQPLLLTGDIGQKLADLGISGITAETLAARSYLGVPLLLGNRVTGVLAAMDYRRAFAFTDRHERSLAAIAAPIAAAVDGARLYEESAQRALALEARATLLGRISAQMSELGDLESLLQLAARVVAETLLADVGGAIAFAVTPDATRIAVVAHYPDSAASAALPQPTLAGSRLVDQLAATLAPASLADFGAPGDPALAQHTAWLAADVHSALFLPLVTAEKLIGMIAVGQTSAPRQFTSGEVDLAQTLASQAAVAVANARLQQEIQPRLVEIKAILQVCQSIGQPTRLQQLVETIALRLSEAFKIETIYLALHEPARAQVSFPLFYESGKFAAVEPQAPGGAVRHILQQQALFLLGAETNGQLPTEMANDPPVRPGRPAPRSLLGVPLIVESRTIGVLAFEDLRQTGKFTDSHVTVLSTIAGPIAAAVETLRLRAELAGSAQQHQGRVRQLATLNRLSTALAGALDPERIVRAALRELQNTLEAEHAAAALLPAGDASPLRLTAGDEQTAPAAVPAALLDRLRQAGAVLTLEAPSAPEAASMAWAAPNIQSALADRSYLAVPLFAGDRLAAVLVLANSAGRNFTAQDVELAATSASQAALALENAHLYEQARAAQQAAQEHAAHFNQLSETSSALASARRYSQLAAVAFQKAQAVLPFDRATFWAQESANRLRVIGAAGFPDSEAHVGQTVEISGENVLADVLAGQRVLAIADTARDPRFPASSERGARSWLAIPLLHQGEALGVLALEKTEANFYTGQHLAWAEALAAPLAAVLDKTRLYEAALQRTQELEAHGQQLALTSRASAAIAAAPSSDEALDSLLAGLAVGMGAEHAAALLFDGAEASLRQRHAPAVAPPAPPAPGSTAGAATHPLLERLRARPAGAPLAIADTAAERLTPDQLAWIGPDVKAALLVSLRVGDDWLGAAAVGHSAARHQFSPTELELAQTLADRAALSIDSLRQQALRQAQMQEKVLGHNMALALGLAADRGQLRQALAEAAERAFGSDTYALALADEAQGQLRFEALVEAGTPREAAPPAPGSTAGAPARGVFQHILRTRQTLLLAGNVPQQLKALGLPGRGAKAKREAGDPSASRAFLGAALTRGDQAVGVVTMEHAQHADAFGPRHTERIEALARHLVSALNRIQAAEKAQHAAEEAALGRGQAAEQAARAIRELAEIKTAHEQAAAASLKQLAEARDSLTQTSDQVEAARRDLAEAQARVEQTAQTSQALEQELSQMSRAMARLRAQVRGVAESRPRAAGAPLPASLEQSALLASKALNADLTVIYRLDQESGKLVYQAGAGPAGSLPAPGARRMHPGADALAAAALSGGALTLSADLDTDPRWAGVGGVGADGAVAGVDDLGAVAGVDDLGRGVQLNAPTTPKDADAETEGAVGAVADVRTDGEGVHTGPGGRRQGSNAPTTPASRRGVQLNAPPTPPAEPTPPPVVYRSGLATPLWLPQQDGAAGVLLLLATEPDAFQASQAPLAEAAASQIAAAIHADTLNSAWQAQVQQLEQLAAGELADADADAPIEAADWPRPERVTTRASAAAPAFTPPAFTAPVEGAPIERGAPPELADPAQDERTAPAWRGLAVPAALVGIVLCLVVALAANFGPIQQAASGLFGGAEFTPTASASAPAVIVSTEDATASAALTAAAQPTATFTAEPGTATPTETQPPTETPPPTDTPVPTETPAPTLPPGVRGLATVVLVDGVNTGRLRNAPNGDTVAGLPADTEVYVLMGRETTPDGIIWVQVRLTDDSLTGWISESLLAYQQ